MSDKPYWQRVHEGEEPVFHDGFSGWDWAEEQRDAYYKALQEAAAEIALLKRIMYRRLQLAEDVVRAVDAVFGNAPTVHDATAVRAALAAWRAGGGT